MATFSIVHVRHNVAGNMYEHVFDLVGPASYTTNGETFDAAAFAQWCPKLSSSGITGNDVSRIVSITAEPSNAGYTIQFYRGNLKLRYYTLAGVEATAATNFVAQGGAGYNRVTVRYGAGVVD